MAPTKNDPLTSGIHSVREAAAKIGNRFGRGKTVVGLVAIAVAIVIVIVAAAFALPRRPWQLARSLAGIVSHPTTVAEARAEVKAHPRDARARIALANMLFEGRRRTAAVTEYRRALKLEPTATDSKMVSNLVACYGHPQGNAAEQLLVKYRIASATPRLEAMTGNKDYDVRWGAVETLHRLRKASRDDYVKVYVADLESNQCALKRRAVDRLGRIGDRNALPLIEEAAKKDKAAKPWYWFSCLGDRPQHAEKEIRARTRAGVGT